MCELCSSNKELKDAYISSMLYEADELRKLANYIEKVANGRIPPHSKEATIINSLAREAIAYLVNEWM